jgi:hypothetical protein
MAVFWCVAPCSLVEVYVTEILAASITRAMIAVMMEAASISVMPVNFYQHSLPREPEISPIHRCISSSNRAMQALYDRAKLQLHVCMRKSARLQYGVIISQIVPCI